MGISVGTLANTYVIITISAVFGWKAAYHAIGAVSVAFVAIWALLAAESPNECWYISTEEKAFLRQPTCARESFCFAD